MNSKIYTQFALNFAIMFVISTFLLFKFSDSPTWVRTGLAAMAFTDLVFFFHAFFTAKKRKLQEAWVRNRAGDYYYNVKYEYTDKEGNKHEDS